MKVEISVEHFLRALKTEYGYSSHTIRAYTRDLESFLASTTRYGSLTAEELTPEDFRDFLWIRQQDGLAASSLARMVACYKSYGNWLEENELVRTNPAARLRIPKKPKALPKVLTVNAIRRILEDAKNLGNEHYEAQRDYTILEFLYATAIRVSELCSLNIEDIDLENRTARVFGKGARERVVPFGKPGADALRVYLGQTRERIVRRALERAQEAVGKCNDSGSESGGEHTGAAASAPAPHSVPRETFSPNPQPGQPLFLNLSGTRLGARSAYRIVSQHLSRALPSGARGPHTLRHSAATHLLDGEAELRVVQEFLGHASLASTQIYTHVSQERIQKLYTIAHPRA